MTLRASLSSALRLLRAARPEELRFAARAWLLAVPVELSLAAAGLKRTLAWIDRLPRARAPLATSVDIEAAELWVARAYRLQPIGGECLPRSLVQYALHLRDGRPARFVVGVRRRGGIEAHAWVEAGERCATRGDDFVPLLVSDPSP
jgi:hypothetical protein